MAAHTLLTKYFETFIYKFNDKLGGKKNLTTTFFMIKILLATGKEPG